MRPIISASNLSKQYWLGRQSITQGEAFRDVLVRGARNLVRNTRNVLKGQQIIQGDTVEPFWALKDVTFEIMPGEVVGIVGRNGAGKSTLLKILSRITEPTSGKVTLRGRTSSLLEVGTGFHPELSGRENIFLNGSVLGLKRREIQSRFDAIVEFSGVSTFLDTPVKRYSSGMYVRLAFAVAAHLDPEILIVDEVLSVGDAEFQNKCLGKMGEVARSGRTVLLVSHNLSSLRSLCSTGVLLSHGSIEKTGTISEVLTAYASAGASMTEKEYTNDPIVKKVAVSIVNNNVCIELHYQSLRGVLGIPGLSFVIHDCEGRPIFGHNPMMEIKSLEFSWPDTGVVKSTIETPYLLDGMYMVSIYLGDNFTTIFRDPHCLMFNISGQVQANYQLPVEQVGPVWPRCRYEYLSS